MSIIDSIKNTVVTAKNDVSDFFSELYTSQEEKQRQGMREAHRLAAHYMKKESQINAEVAAKIEKARADLQSARERAARLVVMAGITPNTPIQDAVILDFMDFAVFEKDRLEKEAALKAEAEKKAKAESYEEFRDAGFARVLCR